MPQQVTGRIGYEGAGQGPYGPGPGTPGWDVVPAPRPAPVAPHPAPSPAWATAPYVAVSPVAAVAPAVPASPAAPRSVVVVALTVVALAVLTLVGVLLHPWATAPGAVVTAVPAAPTTVVVPAPSSASGSSSGAYSCGSANGYAIEVQNGNVPCTSARWVTTMWTTDGTTPMNGAGPAGTPYSWTCSSTATSGVVGSCVSRMGSTFTISR